MGASQSHCEAHPEAAGGQKDIQSSDTATKSKATTEMPKDAGKSNSKDDKEGSAPKDDGKDSADSGKQSKGVSKTEGNFVKSPSNGDDSDKSDNKSNSKDSKPESQDDGKSKDKPDNKADSQDSKSESKGDDKPKENPEHKADTKDIEESDREENVSDGSSNGVSKADSSDDEASTEETEEEEEEEPSIKRDDVTTAPYDHRFPSFNQARHCFTRYNEFYKCKSEKGEESPDCRHHQKAYRSICPSEWLDRWNEQRESGTWPGRY